LKKIRKSIIIKRISKNSRMVQYKVPQDVQREDQVLWFITLKQLIILLIGFGISYTIFVNANRDAKANGEELEAGTQVLIWMPAMIAAAFAFVKIKAIPLFQFILLFIENTFFRMSRRYWIAGGGDTFVSMTQDVQIKKKEIKVTPEKEIDKKKIKSLATFLDSEKSSSKKQSSEVSPQKTS